MLVAAAVCPCPPLLVPEVAGGAAHEMDDARAACFDAIGVLAAARVDRLVVVGPADQPGRGPHPQGARGSFRGFGTDLQVTLGPGTAGAAAVAAGKPGDTGGPAGPGAGGSVAPGGARGLPPSLTVGAWLLARTDWNSAPVEGLGVGEPLTRERCAVVGREIAGSAPRVALLVMGDGSACRTLKAPGYFDERAAAFDAAAGKALGAADLAGLRALDEELAYELKAAGRACWQVLAGAAEGAGLSGRLLYDAAPYGVGYLVASWA